MGCPRFPFEAVWFWGFICWDICSVCHIIAGFFLKLLCLSVVVVCCCSVIVVSSTSLLSLL